MRGNDEKKVLGLQLSLGVAGHKTRNGALGELRLGTIPTTGKSCWKGKLRHHL
jgi:hypothetical protein